MLTPPGLPLPETMLKQHKEIYIFEGSGSRSQFYKIELPILQRKSAAGEIYIHDNVPININIPTNYITDRKRY
jgi:hypothetical protein